MQHAILFGEHELTIDHKNRLLVPAEIRKRLDPQRDGEAFFIIVGHNRKPWLYAEMYWNQLATQLEQHIAPDEDLHEFEQMQFARARRIEWDKLGRILLPEKTLQRTATGKDVTLIGVRDHLEIWNRAEWDVREEELTGRMQEIMRRIRQGRKEPPT